MSTFVFGPDAQHAELAAAWGGMARFTALLQQAPIQQQKNQQEGNGQPTWEGGQRSLLRNADGQLVGGWGLLEEYGLACAYVGCRRRHKAAP